MVACSCRPTSSSGAVGAALSVAVTVLDLLLRTALEHFQSRPSLAVQEFSLAFNRCASSGATSLASALRSRGTALRRAPSAGAAHSARQLASTREYRSHAVGLFADRRLNMEGNMIVDAGATALGRALAVHSELLPLRVCLRSHAQLVLCHCSHSRSTC